MPIKSHLTGKIVSLPLSLFQIVLYQTNWDRTHTLEMN
jgi:hypothetical protein